MALQPPATTRPNVIVGVDGSESSRRALHWAAAQAGRRRLPLRVLHAVDLPRREVAIGRPETIDIAAARRLVDSAVADVERTWPEVTVYGEWLVGIPPAVLVRSANRTDLVVVGSRGWDRLGSMVAGSVSTEVAQRATCPVVVVRWPRPTGYFPKHRGVVVGVDGSAGSMEAVDFAFAAAAERGLPLTAVQVAVAERERLDIAETVADWTERYPDVAVHMQYETGQPAQVLADLSAGADLLVIGSHGRDASAALRLGSVSRHVLERAECAVAIVRGQPGLRSHDRGHAVAGLPS
jgi:nucleotide-binding universal stress UspA family protein